MACDVSPVAMLVFMFTSFALGATQHSGVLRSYISEGHCCQLANTHFYVFHGTSSVLFGGTSCIDDVVAI